MTWRLGRWQVTPARAILLALFLGFVAVCVVRLFTGLGAVTGMNDTMPWGIWKTIHIIVYIPLGASGFTLAFIRYFVPGGHRYEMIMRRAVIWAAIAYLSAAVTLTFDIGLPWRIVYPLIFWGNVHSPLFEVAWCMALYLFVLFLENSPRAMEGHPSARIRKLEEWLHKILPVFVLFGVLLSTMHQSTLGTIFMIAGKRLDPLWYHPWINYLFLLTAVASGLSVAILIEAFSHRCYRTPFEKDLLARFAPWIAGTLGVALAWRIASMAGEGSLGLVLVPNLKTALWWGEILVGYVLPILILASPLRRRGWGLVLGAAGTVAGLIAYRLNTAITAMWDALHASYVPEWPEILFSAGAIAGTLVAFTWLAETLPSILGRTEQGHGALPQAGD